MNQSIEIPACCPECGGKTCIEWDYTDVALSRLHCRPQHATPAMCSFSMPLGADPAATGYTLVTKYVESSE